MDEAFESIGLQVELDYTKALGQIGAFQAEVERRLSGTAGDMSAMAAALNTSLKGFNDMQRQMRELHTQFSVAAADIRTATQDMAKLTRGTEAQGEAVEKLSGKEMKAARERRKDAEYEQKSLQQKLDIHRKIANFLDGRSTASLNKAERKVLTSAYGNQALTDFASGKLNDLGNNSEQARLEKWFLDSAKRNEQLALEYGKQMARSRKAGADIVRSGEGVAAAAEKAGRDEQARLEQWFLTAAANSQQQGLEYGRRLAQSRKAGAAIVKQGEGVAESALKAAKREQDRLDQWFITAAQTSQEQGLAYGRRMATARKAGAAIIKQGEGIGAAALKANQAEQARLDQWFLTAAANMERQGLEFGKRIRRSFKAGESNVRSVLSDLEATKLVPTAGGIAASTNYAARQRAEALKRERDEVFRNRDAYREMHSAARGVAGGSGLLWLTYGAMLPMAMGAGAVGAGTAMMTKGSEFAENMAFVKALSEDTTPSLKQLQMEIEQTSERLLTMGENGRFSAIELSASMRTLAQAGYNNNQASQMLPAVTNLSTIGETTPDKAALTIAGTLSSFNLGADQAGRVSDVIGAAAAASQTSVEQMMESMKQASSVAQDYGSSLEETAAVLTLLAKRNITGSAAGTAFRNMMVDMAGRTKKATATLQELGIELYDNTTGRARATKDVLLDLLKVMDNLNQRERNTYLKRFADERGLKAIASVISAGPVGFTDLVEKMNSATDNGGFAARMAGQLNETTKAEGLKVLNTLTSQLIGGFLEAEDSVKGFLQEAQQAAASQELREMVRELAKGIMALGQGLITIGPLLGTVTKAFIAFGTAKVAISSVVMANAAFTSLRATMAAIPVQMAGASLSMSAVSGAAVASGGAATTAAMAWRVFWAAATGPIGLAVAAGVAAFALFGDSAEDAARRAKETLKGEDIAQYASEASEAYKKVKESMDAAFGQRTGAGGDFAQKQVQSLQDVIDNTAKGGQALTDMQESAQQNDTVRMQALLDTSNNYYQQQMEAAEKYNSGSAEDAAKLTDFFAQLAQQRYENEARAMDLMVLRSRQAAEDMIQDAVEVNGWWAKTMDFISDTASNVGVLVGGDFKSAASGRKETLNQQILNLASKVNNAANTGLTVEPGDLLRLMQMRSYNQGMDKQTTAMVEIAINAAQRASKAATEQVFKNRATTSLGVKLNSNKPSEPGRTGSRVPNDDYNAAKKYADLAKMELKTFQDQLAVRKALGMYVSEDLYGQETALKLEQARTEYLAQKEQIELNIAKARKAGNDGATKAGEDQLSLLEQQYREDTALLKAKAKQEAFTRGEEERAKALSAELDLQTAILGEMQGLYRGIGADTISSVRARQLELTVQKAQLDLSRDLDALNPADQTQRQLRIEQARLKLAQQIYDLNRKNFEATSRETNTLTGYMRDFATELNYQLADMRKTGDSVAVAMAKGLVSGTESAYNKFFQYLKDPQGYKDSNNGQGYGGRQFLGEMLSGVYDQMAAAMSRQMTEAFTGSLVTSLNSMMGITDPQEAAKQEAMRLQQQDNTLKQQLIGSLDRLNTTLSGGRSVGMQTTGDAPTAGNHLGSTLDTANTKLLTSQEIMQEYHKNTLSLGDALTQMSAGALQGFSFMQMGMMSLMTGTKAGIKEFVAFTVAELLRLWAVQKLVGMVSSVGMAAGGSGLSNGGVDIGSVDYVPSYAMATGGSVVGPGTGTSDSIAAWLSNGEYVINAAAVRRYGVQTFDALNAQKLATGGSVGTAAAQRVVTSIGGGSASAMDMKVTMKLESDGKQSTNDLMSRIDMRQFEKMVDNTVRKAMVTELRQGGMFRRG